MASLNLFESVAVPQKILPLAAMAEPRPVAEEGGGLLPVPVGGVVVGGGGGGGATVVVPGKHWK